VAGHADRCPLPLPLRGSPRQLQVALEHLRDAVHAPVAEGAAPGQHRQRAGAVAVDAAVLHEAVRLPHRAEPEHLEPEIDERREPVVELG
jgi:hypothetical protein